MSTSRKPTVLRGIGRWDLVALMVNVSIGSGILGLPSRLFELTHAYSLIVLGRLMDVTTVILAVAALQAAMTGMLADLVDKRMPRGRP